MSGKAAEARSASPAPELRPYVRSYGGIRYAGFRPGVHRGLPSRNLTVLINLSDALDVAVPDRSGEPRPYQALAAGLHTGPALVAHNGYQDSVSLELTPAGARSLLGVPAAELVGSVVALDQLIGGDARELMDRLGMTPDWQARFEVLDDVLTRRARPAGPSTGPIGGAWNRMVETNGALRIGDLAREIGYSRRQLTTRFSREYGLTPKQAARIMRFERSWHVLRRVERRRRVSPGRDRATLAEVAIRCGYADQSHLDREWNALAGCPPSRWMADEELPFVQDDTGDDA